ncbi:pirin family protein [Methylibium sp.]|uniref:pirin family protein n=1 Tax=Methylibium sp. TaxID=2067992 RepID=UPI003D0E1CE9
MPLQILTPHTKDLGGGFEVRRLLPAAQRQSVGPFVFFDHFGPITAGPGDDHDVRPHPHIGLATVTYLFEGAMQHRDSTGVSRRIEPGAINWMTAGRGIVHSERTPDDLRGTTRRSHGLQLWAALPAEHEETVPHFEHTAAARLPQRLEDGATLRVLIGHAHGLTSPVGTLSPTLYVDYALAPGARVALPSPQQAEERALYGVDAPFELELGGAVERIEPFTLVVLPAGSAATLCASGAAGARVVLIGGAPLGHRHIWWNFVSSSKERIAQAAADWEADRLGQVPGETERIPLPVRRPG